MSLNKYMHPRNRYKKKKPSFLELAVKYPDFRKQITQDESGKVFLDFKNADALRALTTCLLKEDFDLTVHLPSDRLIPTLPLRLNYLHWLEDIVGNESEKWGIDVGTGASSIYPLLGAKMLKWNFLATEADPENFFHAKKNVEKNNLQEMIHVKQVSVEDALMDPVDSFTVVKTFDFCMCNPPFFADHMEAQAVTTSRSIDRPEAHTMSTASPQECIASGGEVGFIRQMIEESVVLGKKIRVYSSMVGKKSSLTQLKEELRLHKIPKFSTTEFCQGKTMRWGIAWSFDESVTFPKSHFEGKKEKKPVQFVVPKGAGGVGYNVHAIAEFIKNLLTSMKIHCYQGKTAKSYTSITLTAVENTWCHQRRRRRQQKRQEQEMTSKTSKEEIVSGVDRQVMSNDLELNKSGDNGLAEKESNLRVNVSDLKSVGADEDGVKEVDVNDVSVKNPLQSAVAGTENGKLEKEKITSTQDTGEGSCKKRSIKNDQFDNETILPPAKVAKLQDTTDTSIATLKKDDEESGREISDSKVETIVSDEPLSHSNSKPDAIQEQESLPSNGILDDSSSSDIVGEKESPKDYIIKCVMRLKRAGDKINLELEWLDGSRELLHQIKTFLVNKLGEHEQDP